MSYANALLKEALHICICCTYIGVVGVNARSLSLMTLANHHLIRIAIWATVTVPKMEGLRARLYNNIHVWDSQLSHVKSQMTRVSICMNNCFISWMKARDYPTKVSMNYLNWLLMDSIRSYYTSTNFHQGYIKFSWR